MRALHLTDRLSARGGADWHLLGVLEALAAGGHQVVLAAGRDDGTARAPCPLSLVAGLDAPRPAPVAAELSELCARVRPDVIHVHNVMNPEALTWAAERGALMTVQDHRSFCPGRGKLTLAGERCSEPLEPALCRACFDDEGYFGSIYEVTRARLDAVREMARVLVLSSYMKRELVAAGVRPARIEVIPPFVHGLERDAEPSGPPCVLFAGRLVASKGVFDAAAAWRASRLDLPLVFAGTGSERARLEREGFEVLGWVEHRRMAGVYRRARALLFPPRWQEPFGIAGLEALWMGVPVAAWDSGGVRAWHPEPGPVPWGDVGALAGRLRDRIAAGAPGSTPPGFEPGPLMERLIATYAATRA